MASGDALAQFAIERRRFAFPKSEADKILTYDKDRSVRFAFFGSCILV